MLFRSPQDHPWFITNFVAVYLERSAIDSAASQSSQVILQAQHLGCFISSQLAASATLVLFQGAFSLAVKLQQLLLVLGSRQFFSHLSPLARLGVEQLFLKLVEQKGLVIWTSL